MTSKKPLKILLVEDERIAMLVHRTMLEKLGYSPDTAEDGQSALAWSANNYDVIFMDIGLPDMSGIEVTAEIRQRENSLNHARIIGLTGFLIEEVEAKCLAAGMEEVIAKPVSVEKLSQILEAVASKK